MAARFLALCFTLPKSRLFPLQITADQYDSRDSVPPHPAHRPWRKAGWNFLCRRHHRAWQVVLPVQPAALERVVFASGRVRQPNIFEHAATPGADRILSLC
jgi:hypothetical protein